MPDGLQPTAGKFMKRTLAMQPGAPQRMAAVPRMAQPPIDSVEDLHDHVLEAGEKTTAVQVLVGKRRTRRRMGSRERAGQMLKVSIHTTGDEPEPVVPSR